VKKERWETPKQEEARTPEKTDRAVTQKREVFQVGGNEIQKKDEMEGIGEKGKPVSRPETVLQHELKSPGAVEKVRSKKIRREVNQLAAWWPEGNKTA